MTSLSAARVPCVPGFTGCVSSVQTPRGSSGVSEMTPYWGAVVPRLSSSCLSSVTSTRWLSVLREGSTSKEIMLGGWRPVPTPWTAPPCGNTEHKQTSSQRFKPMIDTVGSCYYICVCVTDFVRMDVWLTETVVNYTKGVFIPSQTFSLLTALSTGFTLYCFNHEWIPVGLHLICVTRSQFYTPWFIPGW